MNAKAKVDTVVGNLSTGILILTQILEKKPLTKDEKTRVKYVERLMSDSLQIMEGK